MHLHSANVEVTSGSHAQPALQKVTHKTIQERKKLEQCSKDCYRKKKEKKKTLGHVTATRDKNRDEQKSVRSLLDFPSLSITSQGNSKPSIQALNVIDSFE